MGFMKRLSGFLGFGREEQQHPNDAVAASIPSTSSAPESHHHLPRKGFSVPVHVPVDRAAQTPLLLACSAGDGGVQGFRWYAKRLKVDDDGDVADEFINEVLPHSSVKTDQHKSSLPRFEVKYVPKHAKVRNQALINGRIQHQVESQQGKLEWL